MKRIVLLGDALIRQRAGIYYYSLDVFQRMIASFPNNEFFVITPELFGKIDAKEIIVPIKKWIPSHSRIRQFIDIPRAVNKLNADIVIEPAHFGPFNINYKSKRVTIIHDLTPIKFPQYHKKLDVIMHKLLLKRILKKGDLILTNSQTTKDDLNEAYSFTTNKSQVLYPKIIAPVKEQHEDNDLVELKNKKYIFSVGTVEPRKNYLGLIQAFEKVHDVLPQYHLVIAGGQGWKNESLQNYLSTSAIKEKITFTGYVSRERLWSLYQNAALFVYASFYEGFGLPAMEAMSLGVPTLLSRTSSLIEVAANAANFFELNDLEGMTDQMIRLLSDDSELNNNSTLSFNRYKELNETADLHMNALGQKLGL